MIPKKPSGKKSLQKKGATEKRLQKKTVSGKKDQKKSSRMEAWYRTLFMSSHDALVTLGPPSWDFTSGNPAAIRMFGVKDEKEFLSLSPWALSPKNQPDGRLSSEKAREMIAIALKKGSHFFEWTHKRFGAKEFPATVLLTRITLGGRKVLQATVRDVTKQKQNEERLTILAQLLDACPASITVHGFEGSFVYANQKTFDLHGYTKEEFLSLNLHQIDVPEAEKMIAARMKAVREHGEATFEVRHYRKDGTTFPLLVNGRVAKWENRDVLLSIATDITDRKVAEEALRISEERYRELFENANDIIYTHDLKGNFTSINKAAERVSGYTNDEVLTMNIASILAPEHIDTARQRMSQKLQEGGGQTRYVLGIVAKGGHRVLLEVSSRLIYSGGKPAGVQGIGRDITEQKRAEQALLASEARYRELFENINSGVAVYEVRDNGGDFIFKDFNRAGEIIDNDHRERLIGKSIFEVRPGIEKFGLIEVFRRVWQTGKPEHHPVMLYKDQRLTGWYENFIYKLPSGEIVAVYENVTQRKKVEEKLRESELNLRKAQHIARIGTWTWHINTNKVEWSDEMYAIYGLDKKTFSGDLNEIIAQAIHPEDRRLVEESNLSVIRDKTPIPVEYRVVWPDGSIHYVWAEAGDLIVDDAGNPALLMGIAQDITERRRTEEMLRQSQKLESLGVLAGGIAHDFNNLLGGLFGYLDMAMESCTDETTRNYLSKTLGAFDRAKNLTQQLLTFSKGGAPARKTGRIGPVVRDAAQFTLHGTNVTCDYSLDENLYLCDFDEHQISQVISNLVLNAQQAMPSGGAIAISAQNMTVTGASGLPLPAGEYCKIAVTDRGVGIPDSIISRIFDPFFSTKQKGSGLGLSISYSIIKKHGGYIEVRSEPGKGTVFHLYLPASAGSIPQEAAAPAALHTGKGLVLVMDDEEVLREVVGDILFQMGYTTVPAKNGNEALGLFLQHQKAGKPFRMAILDLTIAGGIGGRELIAEIHRHDQAFVAIAASGYSDDPVMADPKKYGFSASIAKPFRKNDLSKVLNTVIKEPHR